jgi:hypothetical protein
MDCLVDPTPADRKNCIASLVCPLVNLVPLPAKLEHLRHKRHAVELAVAVECPQDFFLASYFDPVTYFEFARFSLHVYLDHRLETVNPRIMGVSILQ